MRYFLSLIFLLSFLCQTFAQATWEGLFAKPEKQFLRGKYKKAISQNVSGVKKIRKKYKGNEIYPAWSLLNEARYQEATANYKAMDTKIKEGMEVLEKIKNNQSRDYSIALAKVIDTYHQAGYYQKADELLSQWEKDQGVNNPDPVALAEMALQRAISDVYTGKLQQAAGNLPQLLEQWNKLSNESKWNELNLGTADKAYRKKQYGRLLNLQGELLTQIGDYDKADSVYRKNQNLIKSLSGSYPLYAFHLLSQGDAAFDNQDLKKAERNYEQALSATSKSSRIRAEVYQKLLLTYLLNEKNNAFEKNLELFQKTLNSYFKGKNALQLSYDLLDAQFKDLVEKKRENAEKKLKDVLENDPDILPAYHPLRLQTLRFLYTLNSTEEYNLEAAQKNLEQMMEQSQLAYGENSLAFKSLQIEQVGYYINNSDEYDKAREIIKTEPQKSVFGERSVYHKDFVWLSNVITSYYDASDLYKEALELLKNSTEVVKRKYTEKSLEYGLELGKLADMQVKVGDYKSAESNMQTAMKIVRKEASRNSLPYADALATMAKINGVMGYYDEAEDLLKKTNRIYKKLKTRDITQKAKSVEEMTFLFIRIGKYAETEALLVETIAQKEKKYGRSSRKLINPLNQLGLLYIIKGEYKDAEKYLNRALDIGDKIYGKESLKYAETISLFSKLYSEIGDYERAENFLKQVIGVQQKQLGENHVEVGNSYSSLALIKFHQDKKNVSQSEQLLTKAKGIISSNFDNKHPLYAEILKNIGLIYVETGRYQDAFQFLNEANIIWLEKLSDRNINSANVYVLMGDIYARLKNFNEAEANYNKAEKIFEKKFSREHPKYLNTLSKQGQMYFINFKYDEATRMLKRTTTSYLNYIKNYFPALSEREKAKFWNLIRSDFEFFNTLAIKQLDSKPELIEDMYDFTLATKALLLSSSIKVRQRILNGKDEELKTKYKEWLDKKEYLTNILAMNESELAEEGVSIEGIQQEINRLEKELSERSELFADNFENKAFTWKDVRKTLQDNEAAVEIIRFRLYDNGFTDKIKYAALIVRNDSKKIPELVLLDDGNALEDKYLRYYRNAVRFKSHDKYSYKNYWQPVEEKLGNVKKVFLSPDGVYNQINVESILIDEEQYVIDKLNVRIVSNTKDLVMNAQLKEKMRKKKIKAQTDNYAILVGNPTFYITGANGEVQVKQTVAALPGTEEEISSISGLLRNGQYKIDLFTELKALEKNIKEVNNPKIFHIATHGFFAPNEKRDEFEGETNLAAHDPLRRSGLLAVGAGDLLDKTSSNFNLEDGILDAYEAMSLNFDDTELVVMSACETGLGEVQIGEGVFGLQRAFLVAGAKALVMSLFKVSDDVTQKLMSKFYENYLQSGDKRLAFTQAQKVIKEEYKYPAYWGAFNMIGVE